MKKKMIALLLCAGMIGTMLTGCGSKSETDVDKTETTAEDTKSDTSAEVIATSAPTESIVTEPTELTFIFADGDEAYKTCITNVVNSFNEAYPDITIAIVPGNGGAYSEFLKTKDSVDEFPDMMEMRDTALYVRAGKLAPLSDELVSLFKTTMPFDGKVYTTPISGENTQGIMYNKDYFEANGLQIPTTWDEFITLCQTIKDKGDMAPLVVGGQDLWHMGFWFHKIYNDEVLQNDPDFIAHCYDGSKNFSDETFKATLTKMQELFQYAQEGWASTPDAQITTFLVNDMAAMLYSGTHMFTQIQSADPEFNLGWFAVPDDNGKINLVGGAGAGGYSLSAEAAKDPNKLAAFEAFIKFFYAPENYKVFCETMSSVPTTVDAPVLETSEVFQSVLTAVDKADSLGTMWNGKVGDNELPPDFRNFTYKTVVEVIQGTRNIDSAVEELNKTWNVSMQSFNPITGVGITTE